MRDIRHMTLEERVGQLFLIGIQGTALRPDLIELVSRFQPSGLITSQRNFESLDQIYELNASFAALSAVPPFLAIEQEGGAVDRLKQIIAPVPSLGELADVGTSFVRTGARILAGELRAASFNTILSPVLDLGLHGSIMRERALASGAREVTRLGRIALEEFRRRKLVSAVGHFPGLGGADADPHFVLPRITRPRRALLTEDLVPFNELVHDLDIVRVANAHYPALGDLRPVPAVLSRRIVTGLLRNVIGFEGVVMTDDLTMGAVTSGGLTPRTFLDALNAGNDLLLFSQATPLFEDAFDLIVRTATSDRGLRARIEASVERILQLKQRLDFTPLRNRAHRRARLVRQIGRFRNSIPAVERVRVP